MSLVRRSSRRTAHVSYAEEPGEAPGVEDAAVQIQADEIEAHGPPIQVQSESRPGTRARTKSSANDKNKHITTQNTVSKNSISKNSISKNSISKNNISQTKRNRIRDESDEEYRPTPKPSKIQKQATETDSDIDIDTDTSTDTHTKITKIKSKTKATKEIANKATKETTATKTNTGKANGKLETDSAKVDVPRPPAVNSDYVPVPWQGRLGYACLNTYLRTATPPVFCSRTCRLASILEHRHPLADPAQPPHATKNRPDRALPASVERGQHYVQRIGLANARDAVKMIRWNDRYHIRFLRLSSEMFPFASHAEHGYSLAPFAAQALAEVGAVAARLGHRLTTHPGQFTQLASPRREVIANSMRDLAYHDEMLTLLRLPPQLDRDAVMILHMGGVYGDKEATLDRFRTNYAQCSESIKRRLVLENDDVSWSVHDLLPICEELNIPLVLDYHHHNIIFDADQLREGTLDIMQLYARIRATWTRKQITQKMHYSEPCPGALTNRDRRKHAPRVRSLPPCAPDMDLMIEAKDKEQSVFALMRAYQLPGHDSFREVTPHERADEGDGVPEEDFAMGGPEGRVFWPEGHEDWLRPKKRVRPRKGSESD